MTIANLLVSEFDDEMAKTRRTLERVPFEGQFRPHPKSMALGQLAPHVAELAGFGVAVLTTPRLDFAAGSYKPTPFESTEQLLRVFDRGVARAREALLATSDAAWQDNWQLAAGSTVLFEGSRFLGYRAMFLNHLIHHRAQLGVYLRLTGQPVPGTYGPSADEPVNI